MPTIIGVLEGLCCKDGRVAFVYTDVVTGESVSATMTGGEGNVRLIQFVLQGERWDPRTVQLVMCEEIPIRKFDRMVEGWPYAGSKPAEFIRNRFANVDPLLAAREALRVELDTVAQLQRKASADHPLKGQTVRQIIASLFPDDNHVRYQIAVGKDDGGGTMAGDGWSGYYKRLGESTDGKLAKGEKVYGLEQAKEHVAEIRTKHEGSEYGDYWSKVPLRIQRVTTITEDVA